MICQCAGVPAPNRHGEVILVGPPLVHHHPRRLAEQQLQPRYLCVPQILIEDRRQVHPRLLVEVRHHVFGHDVLILEVLVEVVEQRPPAFGSSFTTLRSVFSISAPLKYWSSGGSRFTPRSAMIGLAVPAPSVYSRSGT